MTTLSVTAAGRAALADQANVGVAAVTLTHMAFGDGRRAAGEDDDARVALRSERVRAAVVGVAAGEERVAAKADVAAPGATFSCTEIGLIARAGGADVLLAYWAAGAGEDPAFAVDAATRLVTAVALDVSQSAADVAVTVSPSVVFGASSDTVAALEARIATLEGRMMTKVARAKVEAKSTTAAAARWTDLGGNIPNLSVHAANGVTVPAGKYLAVLEGPGSNPYDALPAGAAINWGATARVADALVRATEYVSRREEDVRYPARFRGEWILDGGVTVTLRAIHGALRRTRTHVPGSPTRVGPNVEQTGAAWLTLTKLA